MPSCSAAAGSITRCTTASSRTRSPRPARTLGFSLSPLGGEGVGPLDQNDFRRRNVARRHNAISIEVQLEDCRLPDLLVIHLALGLGSAVEQDPGGLPWVCLADQKRALAQ